MNRLQMLHRLRERSQAWDLLVIGGGATGMGIAVDAASRGYEVVLVERGDFGSGTSSRSTKLIHGGVRYLRNGEISLVLGALRERGRLRQNAPHLVHDLPFVLPCYRRFDLIKYGMGLKLYDLLADRLSFGRSVLVSARHTRKLIPTVQDRDLRGGVLYHDGQFDDARLLIHLARTAVNQGATIVNYLPVVAFSRKHGGAFDGVITRDLETGIEYPIHARLTVNAAGPFCDEVRRLAHSDAPPMLTTSQGSHVVLSRDFLPGPQAMIIPETPDGRVLFLIPWHGHTLVGTTDVPILEPPIEPRASHDEIDFILETAGRYLTRPPRREDVLSTFAGVRPLVKSEGRSTAALSRDHTIRQDGPGLLTITGGKWTTYRAMAEECVNLATRIAGLPQRTCVTATLRIHGFTREPDDLFAGHGSDAMAIRALMAEDSSLGEQLHPELSVLAAEVVWAVRHEMARTLDDVLARRTRALHLHARAAEAMAPRVADLMARELGRDVYWRDEQLQQFQRIAKGYRVL